MLGVWASYSKWKNNNNNNNKTNSDVIRHNIRSKTMYSPSNVTVIIKTTHTHTHTQSASGACRSHNADYKSIVL